MYMVVHIYHLSAWKVEGEGPIIAKLAQTIHSDILSQKKQELNRN